MQISTVFDTTFAMSENYGKNTDHERPQASRPPEIDSINFQWAGSLGTGYTSSRVILYYHQCVIILPLKFKAPSIAVLMIAPLAAR